MVPPPIDVRTTKSGPVVKPTIAVVNYIFAVHYSLAEPQRTLGTAAIAGISVGGAVVVLALLGLLLFCCRQRRKKTAAARPAVPSWAPSSVATVQGPRSSVGVAQTPAAYGQVAPSNDGYAWRYSDSAVPAGTSSDAAKRHTPRGSVGAAQAPVAYGHTAPPAGYDYDWQYSDSAAVAAPPAQPAREAYQERTYQVPHRQELATGGHGGHGGHNGHSGNGGNGRHGGHSGHSGYSGYSGHGGHGGWRPSRHVERDAPSYYRDGPSI